MSERPSAVTTLIVLHILLGIGALGGGALMVADPSGAIMGLPLSMLNGLPFRTFLIPGIALALMLGIFPLVVSFGLIKPQSLPFLNALNLFRIRQWPFAGSFFLGVYLIGWTMGEMVLWGWVWLSALYCVWGITIIIITLQPTVKQWLSISNNG